jgi:methionyl-tRNA formyltransferase
VTRVAFLGTPQVAVPTLRRLAAAADLRVAVTRPDRPRGRSGTPQPSPVKHAALDLGIPVVQPGRRSELEAALAERGPLDVAVVVAFGMILPARLLDLPGAGFLNAHFSILPRWRGAAPVQRALLAGDRRTGVSVMRLDAGLDTGPVLAIRSTGIGDEETAGELLGRLAGTAAELVVELLDPYLTGRVVATPQPGGGSAAPKLTAEDSRLRLDESPEQFVRRVRAMSPAPGAAGQVGGEGFKVLRARVAAGSAPSGGLAVEGGRLLCGTGGGRVELEVVQPAGRRPMAGIAWASGRRGELGRLT